MNIDDWKKAGEIAVTAREYGLRLIKPGAKRIDVLDAIEAKIKHLGGFPAFPAQISFNNVAAHDCSDPEDPTVFEDQVIKMDIGVHVNGAVADTARSVDLSGQWTELINASEAAQREVCQRIRPDITLGEIGKFIQDAISDYGFSPIKNLCGHGLDLYCVHTKPTIPNYENGDQTRLKPGMFFAVEPFATNGIGMIQETESANLFSVKQKKPIRSQVSREVFKVIETFHGLPFTTRWLVDHFPLYKVKFALRDLLNLGVLNDYPPLTEKGKGMVTQCENSFYVTEDKVINFTPNEE